MPKRARKRSSKSAATWQDYRAEILAGLDLLAEFEALGVDVTGQPSKDGWAECHAVDRPDDHPSAAVNVHTGHYRDLGGEGLSLSFFDLAAHVKQFSSWKDARDHYAARAGVVPPNGQTPRDPAEHLVFMPWSDSLVALWCRHKPPVTPEAVRANGGRLARYREQWTVVALPVFGPGLTAVDPIGWVLWNTTGRDLPVFRQDRKTGKLATDWKKMKTTGGSESGLLGRWAIDRLTDPAADPAWQLVWKVEGPGDLLALFSAIPPEKRETHLVLTNAGGAQENPAGWMAGLFAGRLAGVVGDADEPGQIGARKWAAWIARVAAETRIVLPAAMELEVVKNHGADARDWLQTHTYTDFLDLLKAAEPVLDESVDARTEAVQQEAPDAPDETAVVEEADDDPHRLARVNLHQYATRTGGRTLRYWRDEWYTWKGNRYRKISEKEFRAKITAAVKQEFNRLYHAEVAAADAKASDGQEAPQVRKVTMPIVSGTMQATASLTILSGDVEPNTWIPDKSRRRYVSLKNGLLDLDAVLAGQDEADCIRPNSPDWFSMVSLPYDFNPNAGYPRWEAFLERNLEMDPERIKVLQEWAGYMLIDDTGEQKFLLMEGEGANGKSVYTTALTAMLGEDNVSSIPLEVFGDRFARTETLGKMLNTSGDCGELDKVAEGYLKAFTGGDRMFFDRKGVAGVNCRPTARLMLSCNNRPRFSDRSDGVWRRMMVIPWEVEIPVAERVQGMARIDWWQESGELPGILNWAIAGLARLRTQGAFTRCRKAEEALLDYREEMNPARSFLLQHVEEAADSRIRSAGLYRFYNRWAKENGYHPLAERSFGKEVRRTFKKMKKKRGGNEGDRYWFYQGLTFTSDEIGGESTHDALLF